MSPAGSFKQSCGRPDVAAKVRSGYVSLGQWPTANQLPIVYMEAYNIRVFGLERLHPFDASKFGKVIRGLVEMGVIKRNQLVETVEASQDDLLEVHTKAYLRKLHTSKLKVAEVLELYPIVIFPNCLVQRILVRPARFHTAGTMLAAALAVEHGWSINIGGGQHHAYWEDASAGGWCLYSDLTLALRRVRAASGGAIQKVMIVDVDVHQGNGHARDKLHFGDVDTFIVDLYNSDIWPADAAARAGIGVEGTYPCGTGDAVYLPLLRDSLRDAFAQFAPDLLLYNAGTDVLVDDPLGRCCVSAEGVIARDEAVFGTALSHGVPVCMVLSGGYAKNGHTIITRSIANLLQKFDLTLPPA